MKLKGIVCPPLNAVLITVSLLIAAANPACTQEPNSSTPGQGPQARGGEGETRLGKLEFESDDVTEETAAKLREELRFQAAVQTYLLVLSNMKTTVDSRGNGPEISTKYRNDLRLIRWEDRRRPRTPWN